MSELRIVRFMPGGRPRLNPSSEFVDITTLAELTGLMADADGFLVDGEGAPDTVGSFVRQVRRDPDACVRALFFTVAIDPFLDALGDGLVNSPDDVIRRTEEMKSLAREIRLEALHQGRDFRLLAYLYLRGDRELMPLRRPFTPHVYGYPVADCLDGEKSDEGAWLNRLAERGLIRKGTLVDRIRLCPRCGCSHLNFVDVCPNCNSIDIEKKDFIHCFTCGRVASQEKFLRENFLQCPFCRARLRHLGVDYDHPLESHECNDCGHRFVEPDVVARCNCCGSVSKPDELPARNIYGYSIAEKGRTSARVGSLEDVYALLDQLNFVIPAYFNQMLDWFIQMDRRYPDAIFSLVGLRFINMSEITESQGQYRAIQLIDALAERLREVIRSTDLGTRTSLGTVWLLLPRTDAPGCRILQERLSVIGDMIPADFSVKPIFRTVCFTAPEDLESRDTAAGLLARLSEELDS